MSDPQMDAARRFGGRLFDAAFGGDLLNAWTSSVDHSRKDGHGLRLGLQLTAAPSIASLPWELLFDPRSTEFLAQSEWTPVSR